MTDRSDAAYRHGMSAGAGRARPASDSPGRARPASDSPGRARPASDSPTPRFSAPIAAARLTRRGAARTAAQEALREAFLARVPAVDEETLSQQDAVASHDAALLACGPLAPPEAAGVAPAAEDRASAPPDGADIWLRMLPWPLLSEYSDASAEPAGPEAFKAGFWDRSSGEGTGFASGGAADRLEPGPVLAMLARDAADGLAGLSDDELIGLLRAARRLSSWASSLELSAAADLMRRRLAEEAGGQPAVAEHASDEIAAALTLTGRSAGLLADRAMALDRLPGTMGALAAGDIDLARAMVVVDEVAGLSDRHAAAVEHAVIAEAPAQTTGQLRAMVRRMVIAADPAAARVRKERAQRDARVERWDEPAGTSALAGRDLPVASAVEADHHLSELARALRAAGAEGSMDQLRAQAFLALLSGRSPQSLLVRPAGGGVPTHGMGDTAPGDGHTGPGSTAPTGGPFGQSAPAAAGSSGLAVVGDSGHGARLDPDGRRGLAGSITLTMPVSTWLGLSESPGEVAGRGPCDARDSRALLDLLWRNPATTWCLTLTGRDGTAVAHGCAPTGPSPGPPLSPAPGPGSTPGPGPAQGSDHAASAAVADFRLAWLYGLTIGFLEEGVCGHSRRSLAYRPPPSLQHLVRVRRQTCSFPGCRRPAGRCDLDHTLAFDRGGVTCECNLAPLCRAHHRAKQAHGWHLEQPEPGVMLWTLPSGRSHLVRPTIYPGCWSGSVADDAPATPDRHLGQVEPGGRV